MSLDEITTKVMGPVLWLLFDPYSEAFWVYWCTSFALAVAAYSKRLGLRTGLAELQRDALPRGPDGRVALWADIKYFLVNALVLQAIQQPLVALFAATGAVVRAGLEGAFGGPTPALADGLWLHIAVPAVSLGVFVAADLAFYLVHAAFHRIPLLWEFHKTHHAPKELWFLTNFRDHPVESIPSRVAETVLAGLMTGLPGYLLGLDTKAQLHDGVLVMAFYATGRMLGHSRLWIHFGSRLNHIVISPAHHQLHHSVAPEHLNRNFGSLLAIWDWMFGTLVVPHGKPVLVYGLALNSGARAYDATLRSMYLDPFIGAWAMIRRKFARLTRLARLMR